MTDHQPAEEAGDGPKFTRTLTTWIGGATAVVVALGGLAGAYRNLMPDNAPVAEEAKAAESPDEPAAEAPQDEATERPTAYTFEDGATLRFVDGMWVWTTKDGDKYRYSELSDDGVTTVALLKGGGENGEDVYLRWPNAGGQAFESFDGQESWTNGAEITADDDDASTEN